MGLLIALSCIVSLKASYVSEQASSLSSRSSTSTTNILANTVKIIEDANALAAQSNVHSDITEQTVKNLLAKRDEKLHKLNELRDNLEVLTRLKDTVSELLYKSTHAIELASRNKVFHEEDLQRMIQEVKRLRNENVILLEWDDDVQSPVDQQASHASSEDLMSEGSIDSMYSDEAIIRDHREVAKLLVPNQASQRKIIDDFKIHLRNLGDTHEKLADKLTLAQDDFNRAQNEYDTSEKALLDVENATLALHTSHPEALAPEVAATIKRRQADAAARKRNAEPAISSCLLL